MRETEYTYAVARIRANEQKMLSKSDLDLLISSDSYDAALRILSDKGWPDAAGGSVYDICELEMKKTRDFIAESVPDIKVFNALAVGNDFANLKSVLKAFFSDYDPEKYITCPYVCEPSLIIEAIREGDFSSLPDYLSGCADEAYHAYTDNQSGQLTEIIIDRACVNTKFRFAAMAESALLNEINTLTAAVSDIKIARRSVSTGKSREFCLAALSGCGALDAQALTDCAFEGKGLAEFIEESGLPELSEYADADFTLLEMRCDNLITEKAKNYKHEIYGADAVVAYYYGKSAEIRNVRIILSAKLSGVPKDIISERMREIYV